MRSSRVLTAALFSVLCALCATSCAQGSETGAGPEPIGEEPEPAYESEFHFVVLVPDDGHGEAGGWQVARTTLKFVNTRQVFPNSWQCPLVVGLPLRTQLQGRISARYAEQITAEIATTATAVVMHSRARWMGEDFCLALRPVIQGMFRGPKYQIGATVSRQ